MIEPMSFEEFNKELIRRLNGRKYKTRIFNNYPDSIFFYLQYDYNMQNEIAIYTNTGAYGFYI